MKGFEVEYFSEVGTGPRYRVDTETGEIARDEVIIHGEGPLAGSEDSYPGTSDTLIDHEVADLTYQQVLDAGLEPGESYEESSLDERGFRVEVYDGSSDEPEELENVNAELVKEAAEELEQVF